MDFELLAMEYAAIPDTAAAAGMEYWGCENTVEMSILCECIALTTPAFP